MVLLQSLLVVDLLKTNRKESNILIKNNKSKISNYCVNTEAGYHMKIHYINSLKAAKP